MLLRVLKAGKCAYVVLLMATFWMTEVIPMAITALFPVIMFPWLGIMDTKDVCVNYLKVWSRKSVFIK